MLRAGIDFAILPFLSLDINANYRFNDWEKLDKDDVDTNTIRLGAAVRFSM
jgi:opacity protein-like surface antigen